MNIIPRLLGCLSPCAALLLASSFAGWNSAYCQKSPEYVELRITDDGVAIAQLEKVFYAPYTVEPGDTFESISTKFYGSPDYAKTLASALGVPVVHIPRPGSTAYIVSRVIHFRFSAEKSETQKRTIEAFLATVPRGAKLSYTYDGNPSLAISDTGDTILTGLDIKAFHLRAGNQSTSLQLAFPMQPLLDLIRSNQVLDEVSIQREDTKSKAD
jgi:hypothetical protein